MCTIRGIQVGDILIKSHQGFPYASDGKESACNAGDPGFISGSERFPGERSGYPFQYPCLENSILLDNRHDLLQGKVLNIVPCAI